MTTTVYHCPRCGATNALRVDAVLDAVIDPNDEDSGYINDLFAHGPRWDGRSYASCDECEWDGTVGGLVTETVDDVACDFERPYCGADSTSRYSTGGDR